MIKNFFIFTIIHFLIGSIVSSDAMAQQSGCTETRDRCIKTVETQYKERSKICEDPLSLGLYTPECKFEKGFVCETKLCRKEMRKDYTGGMDFCWEVYNECLKKREKPLSKNFPKKITVTISGNCNWDLPDVNIQEKGHMRYNIQGVLSLKERKADFLRYEAHNLSVYYSYNEIGISVNKSDRCYKRVVTRSTGEGNTSAEMILDIFLGEDYAKVMPGIKGDFYSVIAQSAGDLLLETIENSCELTWKKKT